MAIQQRHLRLRWLGIVLGVLFAGFMFIAPGLASSAHATAQPAAATAATCEFGAEQEPTDWRFSGFIKFDDAAIPCVTVTVEGSGFEYTTATDDKGRWQIFVPDKADYTLTVDESTLPEGVIIDGDSAAQTVTFDRTGKKTVLILLGEGQREVTPFYDRIIESIFRGVNFGLLLALAAMGAALIYGTTGLSNFAHGEMVTWGALLMMVVSTTWQLPLWAGVIAAIGGGVFLGFAMDAGLWRPLKRRGLGIVQLLIVSIGLSLTLRFFFQFLIGGGTKEVPGQNVTPMQVGPIKISYIDIVSMGVSIVAILGVAYFLTSTNLGKATRAISDNAPLAAASGIDVEKVVRTVWMLGGGLAALAGVLWAYFRPGVRFDMGTGMLLLIFAAITLGGLGTAFGALVGAIIVGLVVEISPLWIPADLKYAGALAALVLVLVIKPQGLLGRKERLG